MKNSTGFGDITLPDFDIWSNTLKTKEQVQEALKQAFDQGKALGKREAEIECEWWRDQDTCYVDNGVVTYPYVKQRGTPTVVDEYVQVLNPKSNEYVLINKTQGIIVSSNPIPHESIPIAGVK